MTQLRIFVTLLVTLPGIGPAESVSLGNEEQESVAALLFAQDEEVLADNVTEIVEQTNDLSAEQRFEPLAQWVLPSPSHSGFRMTAEFLQTDAVAGSLNTLTVARCEGILSPCFALVRTAEQSGRLDELQEQIEAIPDPTEPHHLRAKLALLLIVHSSQRDERAALAICVKLTEAVRIRTASHAGRWWPETLALAWGMQHMQNRTELLELATAIYEPQIVRSNFSGNPALDIFVAGCYARLRNEKNGNNQIQAIERDVFEHWKAASVVTAKSRGTGCPTAIWARQGDAVHKVVGHDNDYLYFPVPLTGDFEINCDVSGFNFRESQVAYAGLFASHNWRLSEAEIGGIRRQTMVPLDPPLTYPDDWLTCRITVNSGVCRHFISGRLILERTLSEGQFPWLALRTHWLSRGSIRNLIVTGEPSIPASVAMLAEPDLTGWFACFDDSVADAFDSRSWRCEKLSDGALKLVHHASRELAGTNAESLFLYHRPMMENGVIEYEFYYEPGLSIVHPALDRLSFLLEPDGVRVHRITDGQFQRDALSPNNLLETNDKAETIALPLKADAWNQMHVSLKGDVVQLHLNGEPIMSRTIEESSRRQFGLFHFADQSSVQVRRMLWTGEWSKSMDPSVFPPTVRADVAMIDRAVGKLSQSFHHDFRNASLPRNAFAKKAQQIRATQEGVLTECQSAGDGRQTDLSVSLEIGGDFDLHASFRDLEYSGTGNLGAQLVATLAGSGQEIRIARNRWDRGEEMMKCQIGTIRVKGQWQYSDTWSKLASQEGVFRLVRLSDKLHFLFAESETSGFRVLHTENVGSENLRIGDTSLSVFADRISRASCLWTGLRIRAERLSGTALVNADEILTTLNEQREQLPIHRIFDFEKAAPEPETFYRSDEVPEWSAADKGLILESVGQDGWVAGMLGSRQPIDGDFDVTLTLGEADLAMPTDGRYATLMWQIQQQRTDGTRFASMFMRTPTEYKAIAQQHTTLPGGSDEYTWNGDLEVKNVTSLRLARRGKVYTMLARPEGSERDDLLHQTEHIDGPVLLHCLLHTGATGKKSRVLLKSIEVHAEVYNRLPGLRSR